MIDRLAPARLVAAGLDDVHAILATANAPQGMTDRDLAELLAPAATRLEALAQDMRAVVDDLKKPKLEMVK